MNFSFYFFVLQLCFLLVSAYLVRNCYSVCACFRAGASTFQVLARYDSVRARHDSANAYLFPPAPVYIPSAPVYIPSAPVYITPAPVYIPFTPVRARVVSVRACRTNVRARGFPSAPDDVLSAHSSEPSAPALMRLRPRVRTRQLPHAPEGL
jgi:hypothetical protein